MAGEMNYATVCSGIGAPEVAWKELWGAPAFTSEIEKFPSAVLKHHMPEVPNYGDMTKYKEWPDHELGLICGGTPCTENSYAASCRPGIEGQAGELAITFTSIVSRYRPRWLVWENVEGALEVNGGSDFALIIQSLAELGYGYCWRVLDGGYWGSPMRNRHVFLVGYSRGVTGAAAVLFDSKASSKRRTPPAWIPRIDASGLAKKQTMPEKGRCWIVGNPGEHRFMTPREVERLYGFPDGYTRIKWRNKPAEQCPDGPRYKALGNSMAVPVVRWIGERIQLYESLQLT